MRWFSDLQRVTTSAEIGARMLATAATIDVSALVPQVRAPTPLESKNHILLEHEPAWTRFVDEVHRFLAEDTDCTPPHASTEILKAAASSPPRRSARRPKGRSG